MASAARLPALPARAKSLPLSREHLLATHMRSDSRATWRAASRLIIAEAMRDARALDVDIAGALEIDDRGASRALRGERPIDAGDILAIAASGPGGARLARRIMARMRDAVDAIETSALTHEVG